MCLKAACHQDRMVNELSEARCSIARRKGGEICKLRFRVNVRHFNFLEKEASRWQKRK